VSIKQAINRRLVHRIPQSAMAKKMGCTHQWVSIIEGLATGTSATKWADRYEQALEELIEERKAASK